MKKFYFALDTVLRYKEQVLDGLKAEHARALARVRECEQAIEELERRHLECTEELRQNKQDGITIREIHTYENYLESLGLRIRQKKEQLAQLKKKEEVKRNEVVEAKKETSTIDKLKEKKQEAYNKEVQKEEEQFIEEFVVTKRAMARLGG